MGFYLLGLKDVVLTGIAPVMPAFKHNLKRNKPVLGKMLKTSQLHWNNSDQIKALKLRSTSSNDLVLMAWLRSAIEKAADVRGRSSFGDAVRSHTGYSAIRSVNAFSAGAKKLHDRFAALNIKSYKEAVRRLEEISVSSQGEERVQLLRRWVASLREIESLNAGSAENDEKSSDETYTSIDKNDSPEKSDVVLYYDQDLGISPVNFRDVFLHSQALEGITMSMILGAANEEEILLLHELFGLCLTGGEEVHDATVNRILDLSKTFSVYDDEVLAKRQELLQLAQGAITGLKVNADILRIDSEISEIHQNLRRIEHQELPIENDGYSLDATSDATLEVIKESVSPIQLCCRLESLLHKKRLLNNGDTPKTHAYKVEKLKVLSESLLNSASKTERRISDHRQQKEAALHFRVAKTGEVSQIEKDLGAEISVLEKQRDELEHDLKKVKSSLAAAKDQLQKAREEREQFDDANNQLLIDFKSKEDELSKAIISYRTEADTCSACVEFLEASWAFQSSFMEQKEKKVNDELEIHEEYLVNMTGSLLSAYKDALEPAITNLRKHMKNLKRYEKAIDPDEEFLQDIERRQALEQAYLAAESKVTTIFDAAESVKEQFYHATDNVSRKGVEQVSELCDSIEKVKVEFESLARPPLGVGKSTRAEHVSSKEISRKDASPSSKRVLPVDIKSILTQKLVIRPPITKPYIPLGGSSENSLSNLVDDVMPVENETKYIDIEKESMGQLIEHGGKMDITEIQAVNVSQPSTEDEQFLEPFEEKPSPTSTSESDKFLDPDEDPAKSP
ncbi:hypothetical protein L1987_25381 [Smallanthus sonchifolius]|uniref:Uncharacterized protein n=1 Tax=Smallanthus sonchifolius TaxID=185202 RepID=A0ACB9IMB4_9ASTR|nr:hypothetical protein L1987_25381 [Smallanthus sonchifolius]